MSLIKVIAGIAAGLSLGLSAPALASTNLIDATYGAGAGSFELGTLVPRGAGLANFQSLTNGSTAITGWTVGGVGVDWISGPGYGVNDGVRAVDLGYFEGGGGVISTSIATNIGSVYRLTFAAAAVPGFPAYTRNGHVSAGSLASQGFAPAFSQPNDFGNQVYEDFDFLFTAVATTTSISFSADDPNSGYGPIVDKVSVSLESTPGGVPEPGTWAMLLMGFGLIGATLRRSGMRAPAKS